MQNTEKQKHDAWLLTCFIVIILAALFYVTVPKLAHAAALPQYAIGVNGVWAADNAYPADVELGGNGSLSMSPHISAVAAGYYGFNRSYVRGSAGFRLTASDVNDPNFSIGIGGQYHVSSEESVRPQEFAADASIGYRPWPAEQPRLYLIAAGQYGFRYNDAQVIAGVRYKIGGQP